MANILRVVVLIGFKGDSSSTDREVFYLEPWDSIEDLNGRICEYTSATCEDLREGILHEYEDQRD